MKLQINHQTNYFYDELALHSVQYIRMQPKQISHQSIQSWKVMLPKLAHTLKDGFGNELHTLSRNEPHDNLQIQAYGVVTIDPNTPYIEDEGTIPTLLYTVQTPLTECSDNMRKFAKKTITALSKLDDTKAEIDKKLTILQTFAKAVLDKIPYTIGVTNVGTTADEAFELGQGVCQDHTHVFIGCLRDAMIPVRYVSGYIYDATSQHMASHAWAEVLLAGNWYCFDIANQQFTPNAHVYVAIGRDYLDAAPVRGVRIGGGYESLQSNVMVTRLTA